MTWLTLTTDQAAQWSELRADASRWVARPDLAAISVTGKHRGRFLNALLSQQIDETADGWSGRACFCTPQGKILAISTAFVRGDQIVLTCEQAGAEAFIAGLLKYRVAERVKLAVDPELSVANNANTGEIQLRSDGITTHPAVIEALRISAGIAALGRDIDDGSTPLEAGLWDSVNWSKGCYLGQEAIAMMAYRGKLRRALSWVEAPWLVDVDATLRAGVALKTEDGKRAGSLGSGFFANGKGLGLAMITRRAFTKDAVVVAQTANLRALSVINTTIADAFEADPSEPAR